MPHVEIKCFSGRTEEQKELLEHSFKIARSKGCSLMNIGIVEENTRLRKWYEDNGAVHVGTKKFDFFPFTCGYMKKEL
jgi:NRPS condensation-like uncharacterized protein